LQEGGLAMNDPSTMNAFVQLILEFAFWTRFEDSIVLSPSLSIEQRSIVLCLNDPAINPIPIGHTRLGLPYRITVDDDDDNDSDDSELDVDSE
jgi:hypothetical protein